MMSLLPQLADGLGDTGAHNDVNGTKVSVRVDGFIKHRVPSRAFSIVRVA